MGALWLTVMLGGGLALFIAGYELRSRRLDRDKESRITQQIDEVSGVAHRIYTAHGSIPPSTKRL